MMLDPSDLLAAVKRERERCAKIAEDAAQETAAGEIYIALKIADAIRAPLEDDL